MTSNPATRVHEGLGLIRWLLVLSSLSPVFVLWAIRGVTGIDDCIFVPICLALFLLPTLVLWAVWVRNKKQNNVKTIEVRKAEDQREHLLTYLFAMLIPLYEAGLSGGRDLWAAVAAFLLVVFLFWHMRLHYMNLFFAMAGFRIFTVEAGPEGTEVEPTTYAVISKRHILPTGKPLTGLRLGGNVLVDRADA
jgi:hypothetical protein